MARTKKEPEIIEPATELPDISALSEEDEAKEDAK